MPAALKSSSEMPFEPELFWFLDYGMQPLSEMAEDIFCIIEEQRIFFLMGHFAMVAILQPILPCRMKLLE